MIEPSERGTFNPLGGKSCVHSTTRINMLSIFFTVYGEVGRRQASHAASHGVACVVASCERERGLGAAVQPPARRGRRAGARRGAARQG